MRETITINDLLAVPLLVIVLLLVSSFVKRNNIAQQPYYRYFGWGLMLKVFAGVLFALLYTFHYGETDTHYYYWGTQSLARLANKDLGAFLQIMAGGHTPELRSCFDFTTGWPTYWRDVNSFAVCRFNVPLYWLGMKTFLGNVIVLNGFLFIGVWRFYRFMVSMFPNNDRNMAIALLFVPSVLFWGSSLLKDSWCLVATMCLFCVVNELFIERKRLLLNLFRLIFWGYVSIAIRPYSFFTTMGAGLIWLGLSYVYKSHSRFFRTLTLPVMALVVGFVGASLFSKLGGMVNDRYQSIDAIIETAVIIQDDLKKEYYGGNSFDIGAFEPTIGGLMSKAPQAIMAGMFRPYLWDSRNALMLISALETFVLFLLLCYLMFRFGLRRMCRVVFRNPFLMAAFVFMVTYAFFVGLTTANFGALVRYRIPVIVFLALLLAVEWHYMRMCEAVAKSRQESSGV